MIEGRPDWCVSRQRAWGVPIPVFLNKKTGEALRDPAVTERVAAEVEKRGADAWFTDEPGRFLGNAYDPELGSGHRHHRSVVRFRLDPRLCAGAAAGAEMASLAVSRRIGPASRLVPLVAARKLRHARPGALRRGVDPRLCPRRGRPQDVEIARQRRRAAGCDAAKWRRHSAPVGRRVGLCRRSAHRPRNPEASRRCLSPPAQHAALPARRAGGLRAGRGRPVADA